jgi:hypothetical protein
MDAVDAPVLLTGLPVELRIAIFAYLNAPALVACSQSAGFLQLVIISLGLDNNPQRSVQALGSRLRAGISYAL